MTTPTERVPALDGLRGWAVAMVLIAHVWRGEAWAGHALGPLPAYLDRSVGAGVDLFFSLSGFLIGGILLRESASPRFYPVFYLRRAFRILPAYWLLLLSYVVVRVVDAHLKFGLINQLYDEGYLGIWRYLLFVQNIVMAATRVIDPFWLVVTWSLAIEEQFYLLAPWVVRHLGRALPALCLAGVALSVAARAYVLLGADFNLVAAEVLLPCRLDALCIGLGVAVLASRTASGWRHAAWAAAPWAAALIYLVIPCFGSHDAADRIWSPLGYAAANGLILVHLLRVPSGALARTLEWAPFVALGGISYFVYLFHLPFRYVAETALGPQHLASAVALSTLLVLVAGAASRRWFELPLVRYAHRFSYRREQPSA